ncbi:MAG: hypothetical protein AAGA56_27505 [Myxococcota bacterium]
MGVNVLSYSEDWLAAGSPMWKLPVEVFAEREALRRNDATKAGLQRARREGKSLGRPRVHVRLARRLRAKRDSIHEIARQLETSSATIQRVLA